MLNTWRYNDSAIGCFARCFVLIGTMLFCVVHNASACDGIELSAEDYPIVQPSLASGAADSLAQYISGSAYTFCFSIQQIDLEGAPLVVRNLTNKALTIDGLKLKSSLPANGAFIQLLGPGPIILRNVTIAGDDKLTTSDQSTGLFIATDNATVTGTTTLTNFFYGIDVTGSHVTIDSATITRSIEQPGSAGIFVRGGVGDVLSKLTVTGFDTGVVLVGTQHLLKDSTITGATLSGSKTLLSDAGVYLRGDALQSVNNTIAQFKKGVLVDPTVGATQMNVVDGTISNADVALQFTANTSLAKARQFVLQPTQFSSVAKATSTDVVSGEAVPEMLFSKTCSATVKQEFNGESYDVCNWDDPENKVPQFDAVLPKEFCAELAPRRISLFRRMPLPQGGKPSLERISDLCSLQPSSSARLLVLHDDAGSVVGTKIIATGACMLECVVDQAKWANLKKASKISVLIPLNSGANLLAVGSLMGLSDYTTPGTPVMMTPTNTPNVSGGGSDSTGAADVPGGSDTQPSGMDGGAPAAAGNDGGANNSGDGGAGAAGVSGTVVTGNTNALDGAGGSGGVVSAASGADQIDAVGLGAASGGTSSTASSNNSSNNGGGGVPAAPVMQNIPSASSAGEDDSGKKPASSSVGSGGLDGDSIGPGPGQVGGLGGGVMSGGAVGASGCTLILR